MILSGKSVADAIEEEIRKEIERLPRPPSLAVILLGDHPSSQTYVNTKKRAATRNGITFTLHHLPDSTEEEELLARIESFNKDPETDGILVQTPLPPQISFAKVIEAIDPEKDVDGFHPLNMGKLLSGIEGGTLPCTPLGIVTLLERSGITIRGKHAVIVGRSAIVGRPLAALLLQKDATVSVLHSRTPNPKELTLQGEILVSAVGVPNLITADMVREGAVVVDVGISRVEDPEQPKGYRLVGDVDFENVEPKCSAITPVPGGVGPMTVATLLHTTLSCFKKKLYS